MKNDEVEITGEIALADVTFGKKPRPALKNRVSQLLQNLFVEENFDLKNPPLVNAYSDWQMWVKATEAILPPADYDNIHLHPIRETDKVLQFVGFAKIEVPDEEHEDMQESFFILEGSCRCQIGEAFFDFKAGDYFTIPLYVHHNLMVTSDQPVKAILQRVLV